MMHQFPGMEKQWKWPEKPGKFDSNFHQQSYWHVADKQGQGLSLLEKIFRTYFHGQKYFRISFVFH